MTCLHSLRLGSFLLLPLAVIACGDDSVAPAGGQNQGGDNAGAAQQGGANSGAANTGGDSSDGGASTVGGNNTGGDSAGGQNAGGENAGGGASFEDCQAAANELVAIFKGCGMKVEGNPDCTGADYDLVVCAEQCAEVAPCDALSGEDPEAAQEYQDCLELCL